MTGETIVSQRLKMAILEIRNIMRHHDIAGTCIVFDGEGHAEYLNKFDASWSAISLGDDGRVAFKAAVKTGGEPERIKRDKTINMLCLFRDVSARGFTIAEKLLKQLGKYVEIDEGELHHVPHQEPPTV